MKNIFKILGKRTLCSPLINNSSIRLRLLCSPTRFVNFFNAYLSFRFCLHLGAEVHLPLDTQQLHTLLLCLCWDRAQIMPLLTCACVCVSICALSTWTLSIIYICMPIIFVIVFWSLLDNTWTAKDNSTFLHQLNSTRTTTKTTEHNNNNTDNRT